jgi:hypothetical protein
MTSKPNETDSQTNIDIEVVNRIYGKTKSMLDWPLYTPSPNRECLYKVASPGKTPEKTESMLDWPLYTPSPNRECLYKVASPGKTPEKTHFYLEWPLYTPASGLQDFDPETEGLTTR